MENGDVDAPESLDIEFFNDKVQGMTVFKSFKSDIEVFSWDLRSRARSPLATKVTFFYIFLHEK